jgi:poly(A) polymerase
MLNSILNFLTRRIKSTVSRNQIKVFSIKRLGINKKHLSRGAIDTIKKLQQNNFNALVVGGAVRDLLVGVKPKDFDVVTNAKPEQIKKIFRRSRIIGKRFKLVHVYVGDETIEVSTFRSKNSSNVMFDDNGRITRDNSFGERDEDANRRDLSINALYQPKSIHYYVSH